MSRNPRSSIFPRPNMARAEQRYIAPDEIYDDLRFGEPQQRIPDQFPWTYTPVNGLNGLGADATTVTATSSNPLDDLLNKIAGDTQDTAGQEVTDFLNNTPAGKVLLDKVKQKAADGVTDVVKKNAPNLIMLAVAGGAVGGALSAKLGKVGTLAALGVAGWAALQLMKAGSST